MEPPSATAASSRSRLLLTAVAEAVLLSGPAWLLAPDGAAPPGCTLSAFRVRRPDRSVAPMLELRMARAALPSLMFSADSIRTLSASGAQLQLHVRSAAAAQQETLAFCFGQHGDAPSADAFPRLIAPFLEHWELGAGAALAGEDAGASSDSDVDGETSADTVGPRFNLRRAKETELAANALCKIVWIATRHKGLAAAAAAGVAAAGAPGEAPTRAGVRLALLQDAVDAFAAKMAVVCAATMPSLNGRFFRADGSAVVTTGGGGGATAAASAKADGASAASDHGASSPPAVAVTAPGAAPAPGGVARVDTAEAGPASARAGGEPPPPGSSSMMLPDGAVDAGGDEMDRQQQWQQQWQQQQHAAAMLQQYQSQYLFVAQQEQQQRLQLLQDQQVLQHQVQHQLLLQQYPGRQLQQQDQLQHLQRVGLAAPATGPLAYASAASMWGGGEAAPSPHGLSRAGAPAVAHWHAQLSRYGAPPASVVPHPVFTPGHPFQPPLPPTLPPYDPPRQSPGVAYVPVAVPAHLAAALQAQRDGRVTTGQPGRGGGGRTHYQPAPTGRSPAAPHGR